MFTALNQFGAWQHVDNPHRTRTVMCAPPHYLSRVDSHCSRVCTQADLCCHHASLPATHFQAISWVQQVSWQFRDIFPFTDPFHHICRQPPWNACTHAQWYVHHPSTSLTMTMTTPCMHICEGFRWFLTRLQVSSSCLQGCSHMSVCSVLSLGFRMAWSFVGSSVPLRGKPT